MPIPAFSTVTVTEVTFEGDTDPVELDEQVPEYARAVAPGEPAFVVGLHAVDPAVGPANDPAKLESLIGYKLLAPGSHTDVEVGVFPTPFTQLDTGQVFPPAPDGEAEIVGAIWEDFESGSPVVSSTVATVSGGLDRANLEALESPADAELECPSAIEALEEAYYTWDHPDPQCLYVFSPEELCEEFFCVICCAE